MTARTVCALSTNEPSLGTSLEAQGATLNAELRSPEQRNKKSYLSHLVVPCDSLPDHERQEDISSAGWSPPAVSHWLNQTHSHI